MFAPSGGPTTIQETPEPPVLRAHHGLVSIRYDQCQFGAPGLSGAGRRHPHPVRRLQVEHRRHFHEGIGQEALHRTARQVAQPAARVVTPRRVMAVTATGG